MQRSLVWLGRAWLVPSLVLGLSSCGGGSGGGGDGDGGGDGGQPAPVLPAEVTYTLGLPTSSPMTVDADLGTDAPTRVSFAVINFQGTYAPASGDLTVRGGPVRPEALRISAPALTPDLDVAIETTLIVPSGSDYPTAGAFEVRWLPDFVRVTATPNGVDLDYDQGQQTASLSWAQFEDLVGSTAPDYQQRAAFGFEAMQFVLEQMFRVMGTFETIRVEEQALQTAGDGVAISRAMAAYPRTGIAGLYQLTWHDTGDPQTSAEVGPGDGFTEQFTDCWVDDANDTFDELLDGKIEYRGYGEDAQVFLLSFVQVEFVDFTMIETEEVSPGMFEDDPPTVVNGMLSLLLRDASNP